MKTPEQIAEAITLPRVISSGQTLKNLMVAAIEADRAQRPTLDEAEFDQVAGAMGDLVLGLERGREYVTVQEARAALKLLRDKFGPALHEDWWGV